MDNINGQTKIIDGVVYQAVSPTTAQELPITKIPEQETEIVPSPESKVSTNLMGRNVTLKNGQAYTIEEVNINDAVSVITYGSDILKKISAVLASTADMTVQQQQTFLDDDTLAKIVTFDESLDEANKKVQEKVRSIRGLIQKLRIGANDEKATQEEAMKTYQGRYRFYTQNLDKVCDNISAIANDSLLDIKQRAELANELEPVIEMLELTIAYGKQMLEEYNVETARIGSSDTTDDGRAIVTRRNQMSTAFFRQLNGLEKAEVLYKAQIQDYLLQQDIGMTTVQAAYDFIDKKVSVLQMNASGTIYNRLGNERLNSLLAVTEAANDAIMKSSEATLENIKLSTELAEQSGFTLESIEAKIAYLEEGVSLIKERRQILIERDHSEQAALVGINAKLEEQKQEILNLIKDETGALITVEADRNKGGRPRSLTTNSSRPRLGKR